MVGLQSLADPRGVLAELPSSLNHRHEPNIHVLMLGTGWPKALQRHSRSFLTQSRERQRGSRPYPAAAYRRRSDAGIASSPRPHYLSRSPWTCRRGVARVDHRTAVAGQPISLRGDTPGLDCSHPVDIPLAVGPGASLQVKRQNGVDTSPAPLPPAAPSSSSLPKRRVVPPPREYCTPVVRAPSWSDRRPPRRRESENRTNPVPPRTWVHAVSLDARSEGSTREQRV
jgi:hypothetical protein